MLLPLPFDFSISAVAEKQLDDGFVFLLDILRK